MKNKGYKQAVANMAWKITECSDRDCKPIMDMLGSKEDAIDYVANNPQARKDWEQLDEIANLISTTYDVSPDQLRDDVWHDLLQLAMNRGGKVT